MDEEETDRLFGVCPYVTTQKLFAGKWNLLIMYLLEEKTLRFGELQRALGDITQSTLTKQLRFLEAHNLVQRRVFNTIPPKVEYSLTGIGIQFIPVIQSLRTFGDSYIAFMKTKQTQATAPAL
jgi:DNA-binding HxlR family transcriptional regulator